MIITARHIIVQLTKMIVTLQEVSLQQVQKPVIGHVKNVRQTNGLQTMNVLIIVIQVTKLFVTIKEVFLQLVQKPVIKNV